MIPPGRRYDKGVLGMVPFTEDLEPEVMRRLFEILDREWRRLSYRKRKRYGLTEHSMQRVVLRLADELDESGQLLAWACIDGRALWRLDARAVGLMHVGGATFYVPDGQESVPV